MNEIINNFKECVTTKFFCFEGRAGRKEFWYFILANAVISSVLSYGIGLISSKVGMIVSLVYILAVLLPSLGVTVLRLHDIGKSGWAILVCLIPIVGGLILLFWEIKEGEPAENKYGPVPA